MTLHRPLRAGFAPALAALLLAGLLAAPAGSALAAGTFITVASTTSTENSGLFGHILPKFTALTGIEVRVVAKGTGQAIKIAQNGDVDVLFVHHRPSEDKFVTDGYATRRYDVMYNDFVLVGPGSDPAGIAGTKDAAAAFGRIAKTQTPFASRGDNSGTHKAELGIWKAAGIDVKQASGTWYRELGSGMGATLNTAAGMDAYTLADRGTWLSFKNRRNLKVVVEGDPRLFNPYGVMLVNPAKHPSVKAKEGQAFIDWLVSPAGQRAIGEYKINGEQLFYPNAKG
ncbi:MAG TPA: substrate-binding domain-containing protein [bacterium]|jgi:tungstate transport system substrate-binding protein